MPLRNRKAKRRRKIKSKTDSNSPKKRSLIPRLLEALDILGAPINYTIVHKKKFTTKTGTVLTILYFLVFIMASITYFFLWMDADIPQYINFENLTLEQDTFENDFSEQLMPLIFFPLEEKGNDFDQGIQYNIGTEFIRRFLNLRIHYVNNQKGSKTKYKKYYDLKPLTSFSKNSSLWNQFRKSIRYTTANQSVYETYYRPVEVVAENLTEDSNHDINQLTFKMTKCSKVENPLCMDQDNSKFNFYLGLVTRTSTLNLKNETVPGAQMFGPVDFFPLNTVPDNWKTNVIYVYEVYNVFNIIKGKKLKVGGDYFSKINYQRRLNQWYNQHSELTFYMMGSPRIVNVKRIYWDMNGIAIKLVNLSRGMMFAICLFYVGYNQDQLRKFIIGLILDYEDPSMPPKFDIGSKISGLVKKIRKVHKIKDEDLKQKVETVSIIEELVEANSDLTFLFGRSVVETGMIDAFLPAHYVKLLPLAMANKKVNEREDKLRELLRTHRRVTKKQKEGLAHLRYVSRKRLIEAQSVIEGFVGGAEIDVKEDKRSYKRLLDKLKKVKAKDGLTFRINEYISDNYPVNELNKLQKTIYSFGQLVKPKAKNNLGKG